MQQWHSSIAILYAGGTFGCTGSPLSPLPAAEFLPLLQNLSQTSYPRIKYFTSTRTTQDSSQLEPAHWLEQIEQIEQLQALGYQKIVLIHGTDTLAYSAAFFSYYFAHRAIQLVVTGSQYPLLDSNGQQLNLHSDAMANLQLAYQQLNAAQTRGCWVAFDGQLWPGHCVQKIHSTATPTFAGAPSCAEKTQLSLPALSPDLSQLEHLNIAIYYALPLSATQQAAQLRQLLALHHVQALVILSFGSGNLNQHVLIQQVLQQAYQQEVLVVLASQVPFGEINLRYAAGHWLGQYHVLSAGALPLPAIYAKLAWLLCQNLDFAQRCYYWNATLGSSI